MSLNLVSNLQERLREALGSCSMTEFAHKVGVSKQTISAYVNGTRKPTLPTIKIMAQVLDVNESWLLGYDVPPDRNQSKYSPSQKTFEIGLAQDEINLHNHNTIEAVRIFELLNPEMQDYALKQLKGLLELQTNGDDK